MKSKYSSYLLIIIMSIFNSFYLNGSDFYLGVKYIFGSRVIEIMISILFSFFFLKAFLDSYYYMVVSRNNIITRLGRNKYNLLIIKKLLIPGILVFVINLLCDWILVLEINYYFLFLNVILTIFIVILLPKKKDYDNELLIAIVVIFVIKLILYNFIK